MPSRAVPQPGRRTNPQPAPATHDWLKPATILLTAILFLTLFSPEIADTDFWWHLKTGQYIVDHHSLPVPDPFAYTTPREGPVTHFNLTHEWLSQVLMYAVYAIAGFPGIILARAALLAAICGLAGFLASRLSANFYAGIAAACATASVLVEFTADRPALMTFLGVALFVTILELRRGLWALPPLALLWANCHGGFFLGWVVLLAYVVESLLRRDDRRIWIVASCSIAASGLNPNGFGIVSTVFLYRRSPMTANLVEWQPPKLWGAPYGFDLLLYASVLVLILSWKKVRPAHWILFAAFSAASLLAFRNIPLIGFLAPILIAAYFPFRANFPSFLKWAPPILAAAAIVAGFTQGRFFQLRVADWTIPTGAATYLLDHRLTGPIFNTYEQGGYLIWRGAQVFIDGRSLSETVYRDYNRILFNAGSVADRIEGPRESLLNQYGVQVVVMNTMDYVSGALYPLSTALANPASSEWELVYDDPQAVIFQRHPPPGTQVLANKLGRVLRHMDTECTAYIDASPDTPLCARTLARYWAANQVKDRARRMLLLYLAHAPRDEASDPLLHELDTR